MQTSLLSMETRKRARKKMRIQQGKFLVSEDRFSDLPEPIVHDIVSRLPSRSAAWMSTLSKKWAYLLESFPVLLFDEQEFQFQNDKKNDRRLCQFLGQYSLCQTPISIQMISLGTAFLRRSKINHQVDKCLDLALPSEISELVLKFRHSHQLAVDNCNCYRIPDKIFSLGKHLSVLELEGCRFGDLDAVDVPLLKLVSLSYVHICDDQLFKLVVACPNLESLCLQHCYDLRKFSIVNSSLRRLVIKCCKLLISFYVNCPLLQYIEWKAKEVYQLVSNLELSGCWTSCTSLRGIKLVCINLGAEIFKHIFSASPPVKSLTMRSCKVEETSKFIPKELKQLDLEDTYFPQMVEGLSSVESFALGDNVNSYLFISNPDPFSDYEVLCSALPSFVHLESLSLRGVLPPSNESLEYIISICPRLQNLSLTDCCCLSYLKIISSTLKTLSVTSVSHKKIEGEIDAPNLMSFKYKGPQIRFSRVVASHQLVAELRFNECFDNAAPLNDIQFGHCVQMFSVARMLKLRSLFTEFVFTPEPQIAVCSLYLLSEVKARASVRRVTYQKFLSQVLPMSLCRTSLLLNFEYSDFPLSDESSASFDLKFQDHQVEVVFLQGEKHDCVRDHLYEISVQIFKDHIQVIALLKFLLGKALHLKKLVVQFSAEIPAKNRSSTISRITALKIGSKTCEMILG